ncbi:MAG: diguanylate cyclase [Pedobacter sp.]|nr:diguanylate cyclase [Pedobacter sp.]
MVRWLLFLLCCLGAAAQAAVSLPAAQDSVVIGRQLQYVESERPVAEIMSLPASAWQQNPDTVFNRGYSRSSWWLRFSLANTAYAAPQQLLEISYPVLDEVDVWIFRGQELMARYALGDKHRFTDRLLQHRFFLVPVNLQSGTELTVLLKVRSSSSVQVPLALWNERRYFEQDQWHLLGHGLFFGIMGLMVLYSFFVFLALRDRTYLYYTFFIFSMMAFLASLKGLSFQFVWPTATHWNDRVLLVTLASTVAFGGLFTLRFMRMPELLPRISRATLTVVAVAVLMMVAAFFVAYDVLMRPMIVMAGISCVFLLFAGLWCWRQGDRSARLYTIAWGSMLLGGVVLSLNKFDVLPSNFLTENATQVGTTLEVILLAFAIVERINEERRLRFRAQEETLASERRVYEAQSQALIAQREANELLEQRVRARTEELQIANAKLEELSATDQLTGVRNRRYLDRVLQEEYARAYRYRDQIAVLLLDIDHFKRFNDVWGHQVGDDCLRQVAAVMMEAVRAPIDHVARYGGEEFCIVMPQTAAEGAAIVAERIRLAVEAMAFVVDGKNLPVTISIGVAAHIPSLMEGSRDLMKQADIALYQAKGDGRNRVITARA